MEFLRARTIDESMPEMEANYAKSLFSIIFSIMMSSSSSSDSSSIRSSYSPEGFALVFNCSSAGFLTLLSKPSSYFPLPTILISWPRIFAGKYASSSSDWNNAPVPNIGDSRFNGVSPVSSSGDS
jgi:hypothetical protein